ncbi:MAG TPA: Ku protein [Actinomycetota bacterium]|nr:Ku protein [Actinomycetota bacterium]
MPRSIWSGAVNFGLVSIPVKLYSAVSQKDVSFHQIDRRSGSRIKYKRVSTKSGREVPYEEIAKGYEVSKDEYVVFDQEELEELDPERNHAVDIEDFVELDEIDPIYFESTYYLAPGQGGNKAYSLLRKALEDAGRIGIGKVVLRTKEYLCAIRPLGKALALSTMLYPDEIVQPGTIKDMPDRAATISDRELKAARQLIDSLATEFDPKKYKDTYRERVLEAIDKKAKGETLEIDAPSEDAPKVLDLMEALRASVEAASSGKQKKKAGSSHKRKSA